MNIEDSCISCIDTDWSYQLARRMEKEKTNPVLGYRTAGSAAETATGDMLYREMKAIGLTDVTRDTFSLDGWEFEKAVLKFTDDSGQEHTFQMGGYQTNFETDGFEDYELVYLGKGTAADYEGINVKGKLVMVEINQRDEWWISFPVYQCTGNAEHHGDCRIIVLESIEIGIIVCRQQDHRVCLSTLYFTCDIACCCVRNDSGTGIQ